ncbi:MAG TPA: acetyl-CoA carboxylase biotin carboxylase subunit [Phycisphaerae bacterium]|nr:acetyl-CoA carboxylase biotin carboxylase subunit [Phycisphaerae bacterium]
MFSRILVANRGEIALRIIRACRELDIEVVAVYSEADRDAAYLKLADEAICIGPGPASESYLNIPRIISAAEVADVQAIHPGYGFLSENAHFAEVCRSCKIEFIGPSVESMKLLGSKLASKDLARKCNVPLTPGSDGPVTNEKQAVEVAQKIGYPVIIKASAGGGGRGMRVAHNEISLKSSLKAAQSEAEAAFNDGTVFIEKYHEEPRHVEVQILGDKHGHVIHLFERDCSVQRRHQKIIEESPCPVINEEIRQELCESAVRLAKEAGYYSAATVEFIMDKHKHFYFLEVNTRIQVEHPVTELVTGIDLMQWQLRIAAGDKLTIQQHDVHLNGAAIECRINAEDPDRNFTPSPGLLEEFAPPGGPGVRLDTHAYQGYRIGPNYDSMIGKLIVHQPTRTRAIATMRRALEEFRAGPVKTTIPLHRQIMNDKDFQQARVDTGWLERRRK